MFFKVSMQCNQCDWKETIYLEDTPVALERARMHALRTGGHSTSSKIEAVEETKQ